MSGRVAAAAAAVWTAGSGRWVASAGRGIAARLTGGRVTAGIGVGRASGRWRLVATLIGRVAVGLLLLLVVAAILSVLVVPAGWRRGRGAGAARAARAAWAGGTAGRRRVSARS